MQPETRLEWLKKRKRLAEQGEKDKIKEMKGQYKEWDEKTRDKRQKQRVEGTTTEEDN